MFSRKRQLKITAIKELYYYGIFHESYYYFMLLVFYASFIVLFIIKYYYSVLFQLEIQTLTIVIAS